MYMHIMKDKIYQKKEEKHTYKENSQYDIFEEYLPLICKTKQHLGVHNYSLDSGNKLAIKIFLPACVYALLSFQGQCDINKWMLQSHQKPKTAFPIAETSNQLYEPSILGITNGNCMENKSFTNHNINFKMFKDISLTITNIDESSYTFLIEENTLTRIGDSGKIINDQNGILILLVYNKLRYNSNTQLITPSAKTKKLNILKAYIDEDYSEHQYILSNVFRHWYIRNIAHGFILNNILRNNNIIIVTTVRWVVNTLELVVIKNSSNNRLMLNFTFPLPLYDDSTASYYFKSFYEFKYPNKDYGIFISTRDAVKVFTDELNGNMSHTCTRIANNIYREVEINTDRENRLISLSNSKINQDYSNYIKNEIWLPGIRNDSYNGKGKASFMSYIKCSCLNEDFLCLNRAEQYLKNIFDVMFSPTFTKIFLRDFGTSLAYTFFSSVL